MRMISLSILCGKRASRFRALIEKPNSKGRSMLSSYGCSPSAKRGSTRDASRIACGRAAAGYGGTVAEDPWHVRWARAAIRLIRTPSGWIYVHLAATGSGWLNQFDDQGRLIETEQVWWDANRHPIFLDVDLVSGLSSAGLSDEDAKAVAASLLADVTPLQSPPATRFDALKFFATFFPLVLGGWVLAFALLIWIVVTQLL
jgi:hypothetical protein